MWLFTQWGFFSCVCAREGTGAPQEPVDPQHIMVRTRVKSHLESLQAHLPDLIGSCEIWENADAEYPYRILVSKSIWSQVMMNLTQEIDYDNFMSAVESKPCFVDPGYVKTLKAIRKSMQADHSPRPSARKAAKQKSQ